MSKAVTCKRCGKDNLFWAQGGMLGKWMLYCEDATQTTRLHSCDEILGKTIKIVSCKYCPANDLHWSEEHMEDGSTKNVLTESFGLPHECDERKDAMKKAWDELKAAKKKQYTDEKDRLTRLVTEKKLSNVECNKRLYRLRRSIWPSLFTRGNK